MEKSETPRTDAAIVDWQAVDDACVYADFARQLERELDAAQEGYATELTHCKVLREDLDHAQSQLAAEQARAEGLNHALQKAGLVALSRPEPALDDEENIVRTEIRHRGLMPMNAGAVQPPVATPLIIPGLGASSDSTNGMSPPEAAILGETDLGNMAAPSPAPVDGLPGEPEQISAIRKEPALHAINEVFLDYVDELRRHADEMAKLLEIAKAHITKTTGAMVTASERADAAEARAKVFAKFILQNPQGLPDHACAQCVPHSDMLVSGFVCAYHQAAALAQGGGKNE